VLVCALLVLLLLIYIYIEPERQLAAGIGSACGTGASASDPGPPGVVRIYRTRAGRRAAKASGSGAGGPDLAAVGFHRRIRQCTDPVRVSHQCVCHIGVRACRGVCPYGLPQA
jgi:hypothetical protein